MLNIWENDFSFVDSLNPNPVIASITVLETMRFIKLRVVTRAYGRNPAGAARRQSVFRLRGKGIVESGERFRRHVDAPVRLTLTAFVVIEPDGGEYARTSR